MKPVIEAIHLSKKFEGERLFLKSFKQAFEEAWRGAIQKEAPSERPWVLQDLNFRIFPGEIVGLIGRNGAGKTTLLRILSRLTQPTAGRAIVRGRVASLLEMGSGIHPDLTGRENIYLNGAFLGMRRNEVDQRLEEIIEFSEVGTHIDRTVKHYSRGMYVRLAFSVAVHLSSDILLMDEFLDAGDSGFQEKCLQRMMELPKSGKTILLVSHNEAHLSRLCHRRLRLEGAHIQ